MAEVKQVEETLERRKQSVNHVIELDTDDKLPESRIAGRLVHFPSGRTYDDDAHCPPRDSMKDDITENRWLDDLMIDLSLREFGLLNIGLTLCLWLNALR